MMKIADILTYVMHMNVQEYAHLFITHQIISSFAFL